jgi:metal-sulfur cluster biosynthetic enzyme/rhodanese-related sulfurtransferase
MRVVVAAVVVLLALVVYVARRLRAVERRVDALRGLGRELEEVRGESGRALAVTRVHLAAIAAGEAVARDVIVEGSPWQDLPAAEALARWERAPGLFVLDVRTPAEHASGHIPDAHLVPIDELEDRLGELPGRDTPILVHCASGARSRAACETLGRAGYTRLLHLTGGMHAWTGPRVAEAAPPAVAVPDAPAIAHRGGPIEPAQVVAAIRECYDPEIPVNVYDLGLVYAIDIDPSAISVRMTLTSEACPAARSIPEEVRRRIAALGQENVAVEIVWDPPWHPSRISPEARQKLGLA